MSEEKSVIVTGAASGIGQACARDLAAEGHRVLALDLGADEIGAAHPGAGNALVPFACDVSNAEDCERAVDTAVQRFGRLDAMIHFAAIHSSAPWRDLGADEFNRVLAVNVTGSFLMSQAAAKPMIEQGGGSIVLTASGIVHVGGAGGDGRGRAGLCEFQGRDRRAHAFARPFARRGRDPRQRHRPWIDGDRDDRGLHRTGPGRRREIAPSLGRMGRPEEIADAARFLISERASYITGEVMNVNGGASFA